MQFAMHRVEHVAHLCGGRVRETQITIKNRFFFTELSILILIFGKIYFMIFFYFFAKLKPLKFCDVVILLKSLIICLRWWLWNKNGEFVANLILKHCKDSYIPFFFNKKFWLFKKKMFWLFWDERSKFVTLE